MFNRSQGGNKYQKSSTAKLSHERVEEELKKANINSWGLLWTEEKPIYVSLYKQIMVLDKNLNKKTYLWRIQVKLLETIRDNIWDFPIPELSILHLRTLLKYAKEGINPLKYTSLQIIASLILHNYDMEEADSIMKDVVWELAEADSSHLKWLFVDFFEIWWAQPFTIANIEEKLFGHLVEVSECPFRSVKLRILKIIPNLKYLLTDTDILEEIQTMLIRFTEDDCHEVWMKAEEIKLLLFMWKKEAKNNENEEEMKLFEEERVKREEIIKEVIKKNKILVEEREKRDEEIKNGGLKNKLGTFLDRHDRKRGISSYKNRKSKKIGKGKAKTNSSKNTNKFNKKERRNTMSNDGKSGASLTPKESKDTVKMKGFLTPNEISKRTQSVSKGNVKLFK